MFKQGVFKKISLILVLTFVLSGCSLFLKPSQNQLVPVKPETGEIGGQETGQVAPTGITEKLEAQSKIKKFASLDELVEFMENTDSGSSYGGFGVRGGMEVMKEMAVDSMAPTAQSSDDMLWGGYEEKASTQATGLGSAGSTDFSKTNVQVEGVDEADIIKTDGKYVYAVARNNLFIIEAYPADKANILAKIEFKSRPQDIYINGDNLAVYGNDSEIYKMEKYNRFKRRSGYTFLKVFDIKDKKNPKQVRDLKFEGSYFNSRLIGNYIYFVTNNYQYYIADEPILPRVFSDDEELAVKCDSGIKCFAPDIYYFDMPYSNYNFTTVTAVNMVDDNEDIKGEVYLLSGNQNMYVSQNNIYITYTKYINEYDLAIEVIKELIYPRLPQKDQDKIAKIESVDKFILSQEEKMEKIGIILERYGESLTEEEQEALEDEVEEAMKQKYEDISKELEKTVIHKIAINKGDLEYKTFGEVTGQVLNQFSMDEQNGYFRIATTKNRTWSQYQEESTESYSNLYVLDENLKVVGTLEDLAPDEKIYSVRFMQNRAYLVTFKQMDPLFVIDLSVPTDPKVLGELKIPGYSDYLHPYDENTLIGLGKDTGETEWGGVRVKGLKLSLFDVSDVKNPKEVDTYVMGDAGSDSIALHDHKAFLFSKEKNLLVIPVTIRESKGNDYWGDLTFSGAAIFQIDNKSIELKGKIDHSDGGRSSKSDYWGGYSYYDNTVKRSLYIDDTLYTFSNQYLKMNKISDLELIKNLELQKEKKDDFVIIN